MEILVIPSKLSMIPVILIFHKNNNHIFFSKEAQIFGLIQINVMILDVSTTNSIKVHNSQHSVQLEIILMSLLEPGN